jgi:rod shape-determining protein MreD
MGRIRTFLVAFFVSLLALGFEGGLVALGVPVACIPELVLVFVIFLSFYEVSSYGAFIAFFCGIIVDISTGGLIGPWAGAYVLSYGVVSLISDRIYIESGLSLVAVAVFMTLFSHVVTLLISMDPLTQLASGWIVILGKSACTACIAPLFFPLLRRLLSYSQADSLRARS